MSGMSLLSGPLALLLLRWASVTFAQILQPLRFRNLCLHLRDQHFQLLVSISPYPLFFSSREEIIKFTFNR